MDNATNPQHIVIRDACERLERGGIDYMLTGSMALCYFAEPRFTRNLDIVVDLKPGSSQTFAQLFQPDYYIDEDTVLKAIANRGMFNALQLNAAFKVDFIVRKMTAFHIAEFARRTHVNYAGISTWMTSKEDLIIAKLNWARDSFSDTQLRDIKNLMATGYDTDYVNQWISALSLETVFKKAQSHE